MDIPRLYFFDLGNLVGNVNQNLANRNECSIWVDLEEPIDSTPHKYPFPHLFEHREVESQIKYSIIQSQLGMGIFGGFLDLETDRKIGYIIVETGAIGDTSSSYGGRDYEALKLQIKHPLERKDGLIIPKCTVKISQECEECCSADKPIRIDHIRRYCCYWQKTDLRKVLPTEWFLSDK